MRPPMSCTSFALMESPSPVPPYFLVVEVSSCPKGAKIRSMASGSMPMPVSVTLIFRRTDSPLSFSWTGPLGAEFRLVGLDLCEY